MSNSTARSINKICKVPGRMDGKIILVTGASIGCGLELTGELARRGATVIMTCRDMEKGMQAKEILIERYGLLSKDAWKNTPAGPGIQPYLTPIKRAQLIVEFLDLANLDSIRTFALKMHREYEKIDILVSNAGIMATSYMETDDGFEMQIGVNHLGPLLLINLLLPLLDNAAPSRIIMVASNLYKQGEIRWDDINLRGSDYTPFKAYNQSKLANMLYIRELAKRVDGLRIIPMAVHPGGVKNELARTVNNSYQLYVRAIGITPWEGAQTALYCCLVQNPVVGGFYENCGLAYVTDKINDRDAERLWNISNALVGLENRLNGDDTF